MLRNVERILEIFEITIVNAHLIIALCAIIIYWDVLDFWCTTYTSSHEPGVSTSLTSQRFIC